MNNRLDENYVIDKINKVCREISTEVERITFIGFVGGKYLNNQTKLILSNSLTNEVWDTTDYNSFINFGIKGSRKTRGSRRESKEKDVVERIVKICEDISTDEETITFLGFVGGKYRGSSSTRLILKNSKTEEVWDTTNCNKFFTRNGSLGPKRQYRGFEESNKNKKLSKEDVISEIKSLPQYNEYWDLSKLEYTGVDNKLIIICHKVDPVTKKEHGEFEISLTDLRAGIGCNRCSGNHRYTNEEYIERAQIIHRGYYSYENTKYVNMKTKIKVCCPVHGEFEIYPGNHINHSQGCPKCSRSKGELGIIYFLDDNNISYDYQKEIPSNLMKNCPNKEKVVIDFSLNFNNRNIWIEFNGKQHYLEKCLFHPNEKIFSEQVQRDLSIRNYALENGIEFLEIPYLDIDRIPEILQAFLFEGKDITTKIERDDYSEDF